MKIFTLVSLAVLCGQGAVAADKAILELQRDMLLLQEDMRTLGQRVAALEATLEKLAQQSTDSAARSDARGDKLQSAMEQTLKSEVDRLAVPVAGVSTKLDSVGGEVSTLRDASAETARQLTSLRSQMEEMNNVLKATQTPAAAPPPADQPPPTKLFTDASGDMNGKPDFALTEFADFLRLYPADPLAPRAQFNVGQIHYGQGQFEQAAQDFDAVLTRFPDSQQVPDAMYMKGLALLKAGRRAPAVEVFRALVAKFPQSSQASQARDLLRALAPSPAKKTR